MSQLLFISYYFPPSGGSGVQRVLKFVKYLPEYGWDPVVVTVDPKYAAYPSLDESLETEVPSSVRVVRTRSRDPYHAYARLLGKTKDEAISVSFVAAESPGWKEKLSRWMRANLFVPDARVGWVPYAVRVASALLQEQHFDAVLTTGPPHSTHLIGQRVRRQAVPWLADFRDPWTDVHYYENLPMTGLARARDRRLELSVLNCADSVTVVSESMGRYLRKRFDRDYLCIPNGFDPEDFPATADDIGREAVIRYMGNAAASQNPRALFHALADGGSESRLAVEFFGAVDASILQTARQSGVADLISSRGYLSHPKALQLMRTAAALLVVIPDVARSDEIVTGKLFEYLAAGPPIIGIGPPSGDAAKILSETGRGEMFAHDDVAGVKSYIQRLARGRQYGASSTDRIKRFDRRYLTSQLAAELDRLRANASEVA